MNDAYRGALIVVALVALYMAFVLAVTAVLHWKRGARRYVGYHVILMTLGLCVTAGLVIIRAITVAGENRPLVWWDAARGVQILLIVAGLRPLWAHQRHLVTRKEPQS